MSKTAAAPLAERFLIEHGLMARGELATWTPLTGGVSSDLWRVDLPGRTICVKGALERLKVADDWRAPLSRNAVECAWLRFAARHVPGNVPRVLASDAHSALFAMEYLQPASYPVWKAQLMSGDVSAHTAAAVGDILGRLHAASTCDPDIPAGFATDGNFAALRIRPYLLTTARRNPDSASALEALAKRTASTKLALVHGDVSPKNILVGPCGPVLLDAECAWFGDPAFDVAFCINHLLLKTVRSPADGPALTAAAASLIERYAPHVSWEPWESLEQRAATLLPALILARIDGSSPVEYLTDPAVQEVVRRHARALLADPADRLPPLLTGWRDSFPAG